MTINIDKWQNVNEFLFCQCFPLHGVLESQVFVITWADQHEQIQRGDKGSPDPTPLENHK